jgi:uncharacterized protein YxjI
MFTKRTYLIKERVALLKVVDRYDIFDPETGAMVAYAKENISAMQKGLRLLIGKGLLPTKIEIKDANTEQLLYTMHKPVAFFRVKVLVSDSNGQAIGYFKSRIIALGGAFDVFSPLNQKIAEVKGNWKGWTFKFKDASGKEIGVVSKKWAGIGKELFTSADNYVVSISDDYVISSPDTMALLIIAGLSIDVVYKEKK